MKVNIPTRTDGRGLWSNVKKEVLITEICLNYINDEDNFGELIASFTKEYWNTKKDGLIYTDDLWLKEFRKGLIKLGFSKKAAEDVDYSEQGMQGNDYVSMDVGGRFLKEFNKLIISNMMKCH